MEGVDGSMCSQTFFVSQRTKNNKLSLSQNNVITSKNAAKSKRAKSVGRGRVRSTSKLRNRAVQSHLPTMEKYLGRGFDEAKSTSMESTYNENEQANTVYSDGTSKQNYFPTRESPLPEICTSNANEAAVSKSNTVSAYTKSTPEYAELLSLQFESGHFVEGSCIGNCNLKSDGDTCGDQDVGIDSLENKETQYCENNVKKDLSASKEQDINILMCPLCWKSFESKDSQITHMKACAIKNKVPTKQLLGALELIQRQEAERQALGLPLLASKVPKKPKKDFSTTKPKTVSDGYLQLGLALSASLTEAEKEKERDHLLEAGLFEEAEEKGLIPTQDIPEEFFAKPAPIFLNAGKRSGDEWRLTNKRRRNIKYGLGKNPTLLKRTEEERERLITEKVAIILVGDDNGMPGKNESSDDPGKFHLVWEITSEELKMYINKDNVWWTLASVPPSSVSQNQYYVKDLSDFISPSKCAAGSKLMHLSQVPGRNHTPAKSLTMQMFDKGNIDKSERNSPVLGIKVLEPSRVIPSKKPAVKRSLFDQVSKHFEKKTLSCDWEMLVGKSEMSDVTVYTQEDRRIPAHKLVFYVRCPSILEDIITEEIRGGKSSALLFWNDTCFHAAWEFLKYIYCGVCCDVSAMGEKVIKDMSELAVKYHTIELIRLLQETNSFPQGNINVLVGKSNPSNLRDDVSFKMLNPRGDSNFIKCERSNCEGSISTYQDYQVASSDDPESKNVTKEPLIEKKSCVDGEDDYVDLHDKFLNKSLFSPSVSVADGSSPDIFHVSSLDSPGSPMSIMIIKERTENVESCDGNEASQESRASIEYLVSLMEKDAEDSGNTLQRHNSQDSNSNDEITVEGAIEISSTTTQNQCADHKKSSAPDVLRTPSVNDNTCELIVYPTPGVNEKMTYRTLSQMTTTVVESTCKDVKRKFVNFERSDASTPITKKLCITENAIDFADKNSIATDKEEVVDLTLSSPEAEETAGKLVLNDSDDCTIPRSDNISRSGSLVGETTVPDDNLSIPDGISYISNVWDDFDPVPETVGYMAYEKSSFDTSSDCLKKSPDKIIANSEIGDGYEKKSQVKDLNMSKEISNISQSSSENIDKPLENDDGVVLPDSSMHDKIDLQSNAKDGCDITDKLLNASLQRIDSSVFWRDENEPVEVNNYNEGTFGPCQTPAHSGALSSKKDTPINHIKYSSFHTESVTPIADYSAMKTPTLHKELDRYGIKHLKRNQAKKILRHIYNELHPVVSAGGETSGKIMNTANSGEVISQRLTEEQSRNQPQENRNANKKRITFESLGSSSDEQSSEECSDSSSESVILEESMYDQLESPVKDSTLSQKASTVDIPTAMKALIESNPTLYRKILLYEPIWLDEMKVALKKNGAKFNANQLMNYLDEKCITFRLAQGKRHKRKKPAKKKTFSLSQPCNSKRGKCALISSSQPC